MLRSNSSICQVALVHLFDSIDSASYPSDRPSADGDAPFIGAMLLSEPTTASMCAACCAKKVIVAHLFCEAHHSRKCAAVLPFSYRTSQRAPNLRVRGRCVHVA
eukprot:COSAG02_NODE_1392_length_12911_cov_5.028957_5_plen_104_part_00